jgi:hypothetical protein
VAVHRATCSGRGPIRKKRREPLSPFRTRRRRAAARTFDDAIEKTKAIEHGPNWIGKGRLILVWVYFVAGFFLPALPWAPLAAVVTSAIALSRSIPRDEFLARWWEISRPRAIAIVAGKLLLSVALDTGAVLFANWLRHFF